MAGVSSAALGLTVMVGWHTQTTALLQIHPSFVAMVYNTALGFFLCGASLVAIAFGRLRPAIAGGAYAVIVGLLTLGEFVFVRDFSIDQLFMRHYVQVANAYPGRMALNSAIFFSLVGAGILLRILAPRFRFRPLMVALIGSITFAQGLVAFSGYLTGITATYAWGNLTRMAVHTAFGFSLLGVGLLALAWQDHRAEATDRAPRWLPILIGVIVAAITVCLWQAIVVDRRAQTKRTVEARTSLVRNEIEVQIESHILALDRMARRWHLKAMQDQKERQSDAEMIVGDYKGFDGIRWVDTSNHIGWTIPLRGHEAEQGMYLGFEERRSAALEAARTTGRLVVSRPVELTTGGKGFLVLVPLYDGDKVEGYIDGFFRIQHLLEVALPDEMTSGYAVVVSEGNEEIYRRGEPGSEEGSEWSHTEALQLRETKWQVKVWPEAKTLAELQSSVANVTLILGLLISFILAWSVWLAQAARNRSKIVESTSRELESEVAERILAEKALSAALEKERVLLNNAVDVICTVDAEGRFASINPACEQIWGYSQEELIGRRYIELVLPEDIQKTNEVAARITAGETATDFENRYRHKDGSEVHVMWSASWSEKQQLMFCVARDITQRHLIDEKLKMKEMRLAEAQQIAHLGSWEWNIPENKITWSDELYRIFGLQQQEFGGTYEAYFDQVHPEDQDLVSSMIERALTEKEFPDYDHRIIQPDGTVRHIHANAIVIVDENGVPVRMTGTAQDITDRHRIEDALRQSELKFRSVTQLANDAIIAADSKGNIISWNNGAQRMFGYAEEQALGKPLTVLMPEVYREAHQRGMERHNATGETHVIGKTVELKGLRNDGSEFPLELSLTSWTTGAERFYSGIIRDITERKQIEEALEAAARRESAMIENALDVICSINAEGKFVTVSPASLNVWGYHPEELIGRRYVEFVAPGDIARSVEAAAKIVSGETTSDFENCYQHKDGSQVHMMWSASWSEKQQLMFCVAHDITQRQLAEKKLQKFAAELQRSNAELQDFASVASHDLQEPLRKIQSFADELKVSIGDKLAADEQDTLDRMIAAAARMRSLINDLLAFSRVTTMAKPFIPVDLSLIVKEVLSDLEARTSDTGGRIEVGDLPTIDADPTQMRQLLQNLIGNGLKFHAAGVPPVIKIGGENGGPSYRLSVTDNGIGFDEKYLDRIFTVFQRLHGRQEYEGTGIGLAICRKIAERHGGEINARSAPGAGSTFTVTLPLKQANQEKL